MNPREGIYHFRLHRGFWCIYVYRDVRETSYSSERVAGEDMYLDREEARKRVYELNGWKYRK